MTENEHASKLCRTRSGESPHVVVMSAGLWHMLHIHSPADFSKQLQRLKQAMKTFLTHNKVGTYIKPRFDCQYLAAWLCQPDQVSAQMHQPEP